MYILRLHAHTIHVLRRAEDKHSACGLLRVRRPFVKLFTDQELPPGVKLCGHCERLRAEEKGRQGRQGSRPPRATFLPVV